MKNLIKFLSFLSVPVLFLISPANTYAVCPVCTVAVIGGLGLSRILGIDDSISGIWVGGIILSLSFWMIDWINKKGYLKNLLKRINTKALVLASYLLLYAVTFIPMFATNFIGHPVNKILGIDKLIFGSIIGTIAFLLGVYADNQERKIKGKQLFQFQRVVFPVAALIIASLILSFIIN